jgi:hypothetical protein
MLPEQFTVVALFDNLPTVFMIVLQLLKKFTVLCDPQILQIITGSCIEPARCSSHLRNQLP